MNCLIHFTKWTCPHCGWTVSLKNQVPWHASALDILRRYAGSDVASCPRCGAPHPVRTELHGWPKRSLQDRLRAFLFLARRFLRHRRRSDPATHLRS